MIKGTVLYYNINAAENDVNNIIDFCSKNNFNLICINKLSMLVSAAKSYSNVFVILDKDVDTKTSYELANYYKEINFYHNTQCVDKQFDNLYVDKSMQLLLNIILFHHKHNTSYITHLATNEDRYANFVIKCLSEYGFNSGLLGFRYLVEMATMLCSTQLAIKAQASYCYKVISKKYYCSFVSIERNIRFCTFKSFTEKNKEKMMEISLCEDAPTIKQIINFVQHKALLHFQYNN